MIQKNIDNKLSSDSTTNAEDNKKKVFYGIEYCISKALGVRNTKPSKVSCYARSVLKQFA